MIFSKSEAPAPGQMAMVLIFELRRRVAGSASLRCLSLSCDLMSWVIVLMVVCFLRVTRRPGPWAVAGVDGIGLSGMIS